VALDGQFVPLPDGTTAWPSGNPQMSVIWVHVTADGQADVIMGARPSTDPTFHVAAMRYARAAKYQPATKDGKPVAAWVQIPFRPKPQ
jgi:TonB family protein